MSIKAMTDRELLELAAKAAGIKAVFCPDDVFRDCTGMYPAMNIFSAPTWNPLANDGDAIRLAVQLSLKIEIRKDCACVEWVNHKGNPAKCPDYLVVPIQGDPYAATRRAIVRAAAEIGKQKRGEQ